ncbi:hypothetical protein AHAS_Ahas11G0235900 [Arachis hypogaea]
MGHIVLRSQLKHQEFLWTSFKSEATTHVNKFWHNWVFAVLFKEGSDFFRRLKFVSIDEAIQTSAELSKSKHVENQSILPKISIQKLIVGPPRTKGSAEAASKMKKVTIKYSNSNWSYYFFGDFLNGEFVPTPIIPSKLREAALVAYSLNKYVFLESIGECMSHGVFLFILLDHSTRTPPSCFSLFGQFVFET